MKKFGKRLFFFFLPPAVLFSITAFLYYKSDVYADFKHTNNLNWRYFFQQLGDLSTKKLLTSSVRYNSFIFGSSRSCSIYACYLQKHQKGAEYFHYGNWNESIGGICSKLRTVDSLGYPIRNVVMYLDATVSFEGNGSVNPSDHYLLTGEKKQQYLKRHFISFFSNFDTEKLKILLGIPVSGPIYPNDILDPVRNDYNHLCSEEVISKYSQIKDNPSTRRIVDSLRQTGFMYSRPDTQQYCEEQIGSVEQRYLQNMAAIFSRHQSRFWIIIVPLYDQKKLHPRDSSLLRKYFGNNVYDFSGINSITNNIYNFPDRHHFHASISKAIMDSVVLRSRTPQLFVEDQKN